MKENAILKSKNKNKKSVFPDEASKVTNLLRLKDSLLRQEFEQSAELIELARSFGASNKEVKTVINESIRRLKNGLRYEANQSRTNRSRF